MHAAVSITFLSIIEFARLQRTQTQSSGLRLSQREQFWSGSFFSDNRCLSNLSKRNQTSIEVIAGHRLGGAPAQFERVLFCYVEGTTCRNYRASTGKYNIQSRCHLRARRITRRSPLGSMTPTPIRSIANVGRSANFGSISTVYRMRRKVINALSSPFAKCLEKEDRPGQPKINEYRRGGGNKSTNLPSHIDTPPPQGMEWFGMIFPSLLNFFSVMYLRGSYSRAFS